MTITIQIRAIRGADLADLTLGGLTLIGGINAQGKSSMMEAIAEAIAGDGKPWGANKADLSAVVHDGADGGRVTVTGPEGTVTLRLPEGTRESQGRPPWASPVAAGLTDPLALSEADRAAWLIGLLGAQPTQEDFTEDLKETGTEKVIANLWHRVQTNGWEATEAYVKDQGAGAKRDWTRATRNKAYGSKIAESWRPEGMDPDLDDDLYRGPEGLKRLEDIRDTAREVLEQARAAAATDEGRRSVLRETANRQAPDLSALKEALLKASEARKKAGEVLAALPKPEESGKVYRCPHCEKGIVIDRDQHGPKLIKPRTLPADELEKRRRAIITAEASVRHAEQDEQAARDAIARAQADVRAIEAAKADLAALPEPGQEEGVPSVADAEAHLEQATKRLNDASTRAKADEAHRDVQARTKQAKALAPAGLRLTALRRALGPWNEALSAFCAAAGWPPVVVADDMGLTLGGRPLRWLSASERERCRIALRVAAARRDGSCLVLIDGAEILDKPGREGLLQALLGAGLPAVVAMTLNRPDHLPALPPTMGYAYWMQAGRLVGRDEAAGVKKAA